MENEIAVSYFGGIKLELPDGPVGEAEELALEAFLQLTVKNQQADARHIYAYYKDFHESVGGEDWLDEKMGIPASLEAIWEHVHPALIFVDSDVHHPPFHPYVIIEANCDWEEEHGLMLCFQEGNLLTKVSGYDGHLTNESAQDNPDMSNVVYSATNPDFTTRLKI